MFEVAFTNFGYSASGLSASAEHALARGKAACFEFTILHRPNGNAVYSDRHTVAAWSPIGGLRVLDRAFDYLYRE